MPAKGSPTTKLDITELDMHCLGLQERQQGRVKTVTIPVALSFQSSQHYMLDNTLSGLNVPCKLFFYLKNYQKSRQSMWEGRQITGEGTRRTQIIRCMPIQWIYVPRVLWPASEATRAWGVWDCISLCCLADALWNAKGPEKSLVLRGKLNSPSTAPLEAASRPPDPHSRLYYEQQRHR